MKLFLFIVAALLLAVGIRGTHKELFALLYDDFMGPESFVPWIVAIMLIWAIGLYDPLQPISNAFLVLVFVVLFLKQGTGFFDQLQKQTGISLTNFNVRKV